MGYNRLVHDYGCDTRKEHGKASTGTIIKIMKRNKLYAILLVACMAGGAWLFYNVSLSEAECAGGICLLKSTTNIPCPSCGSTRAILSLLHGNFISSLRINPFGIIVFAIVLIAPLWILTDVLRRRSSLLNFYNRFESFLQRPRVMIPFAFLVLINWIWNITKGL